MLGSKSKLKAGDRFKLVSVPNWKAEEVLREREDIARKAKKYGWGVNVAYVCDIELNSVEDTGHDKFYAVGKGGPLEGSVMRHLSFSEGYRYVVLPTHLDGELQQYEAYSNGLLPVGVKRTG